jgi:hypothetical protein
MPRKNPGLKVVGPAVVGKPTPPPGLASDGLELWHSIRDEYDVTDAGGLQLLKQAAQTADRIAEARRIIDARARLCRPAQAYGRIRLARSSVISGPS